MNRPHLVIALVAGCCFLRAEPLPAQTVASPFVPDKQYSADMVIVTKDGMNLTSKVNMDNGKARTEMDTHGMHMINIIRPDLKKAYAVMPAQKMVMEMPLDLEKMKAKMPPTSADDGKFDLIGPDSLDGVACTKYKMTGKDNKVFFWWVDVATKAPLKMMADDGSFTIVWKNYQAGPQDPALFEPPADYQVMPMPGLPGGAGGGP